MLETTNRLIDHLINRYENEGYIPIVQTIDAVTLEQLKMEQHLFYKDAPLSDENIASIGVMFHGVELKVSTSIERFI